MAYIHKVKYYECDRMGVTHHSNYIRFMEEARIDWLDRHGYGFDRMEAEVSPMKLTLAYEMKVRGRNRFHRRKRSLLPGGRQAR